jgi:hypothetical protein
LFPHLERELRLLCKLFVFLPRQQDAVFAWQSIQVLAGVTLAGIRPISLEMAPELRTYAAEILVERLVNRESAPATAMSNRYQTTVGGARELSTGRKPARQV